MASEAELLEMANEVQLLRARLAEMERVLIDALRPSQNVQKAWHMLADLLPVEKRPPAPSSHQWGTEE